MTQDEETAEIRAVFTGCAWGLPIAIALWALFAWAVIGRCL